MSVQTMLLANTNAVPASEHNNDTSTSTQQPTPTGPTQPPLPQPTAAASETPSTQTRTAIEHISPTQQQSSTQTSSHGTQNTQTWPAPQSVEPPHPKTTPNVPGYAQQRRPPYPPLAPQHHQGRPGVNVQAAQDQSYQQPPLAPQQPQALYYQQPYPPPNLPWMHNCPRCGFVAGQPWPPPSLPPPPPPPPRPLPLPPQQPLQQQQQLQQAQPQSLPHQDPAPPPQQVKDPKAPAQLGNAEPPLPQHSWPVGQYNPDHRNAHLSVHSYGDSSRIVPQNTQIYASPSHPPPPLPPPPSAAPALGLTPQFPAPAAASPTPEGPPLQRGDANTEIILNPDGTPSIRPRTVTQRRTGRPRLKTEERRDILLMRRLGYTCDTIARFLGTTVSAVNYTCRQGTAEPKHKNAGRRVNMPPEKIDQMCAYVERYLKEERAAGVDKKTGKRKMAKLSYKMIREAVFSNDTGEIPRHLKFTDDAMKNVLAKRGLYLRPPMSQAKIEAARARGKKQWLDKVERDRLAAEGNEAQPPHDHTETSGLGNSDRHGLDMHGLAEAQQDDEEMGGGYSEVESDTDDEEEAPDGVENEAQLRRSI